MNIREAEHSGTHTDAPAHFFQGGWRTAEIPLNRLAGPGIKLDIAARAAQQPDTELGVEDVEKWERQHGKIPERAIGKPEHRLCVNLVLS